MDRPSFQVGERRAQLDAVALCSAGWNREAVDKLLRQIEAQLVTMNPEQRAEVKRGISAIMEGSTLLRRQGLKLSKVAVGKSVGQLMIWAASDTFEEIIANLKGMAQGVGPHVSALFDAV